MPKTISVIERRLQGPDVFRTSSQPIPVKDSRWILRWENSTISPDHLWNIIHNLGWVYAEPADLACPIDEIGAFVQDGRIVRGERGTEVLMKMLAEDYAKIQKKKADANIADTFQPHKIKQAMVSGVAAEHGGQAGEFVAKNLNAIAVKDSRERINLDE